MEEGEQVEKCIICLESKPIKGCLKNDHITHIPCTCNAYVHEYCFYKTNNVNKCFICKNKYIYSFGHHPGNEPCCKKVDCKLKPKKEKLKNHMKITSLRLSVWLRNICGTIDNFFLYLYSANTANDCCNMLLATLYSILMLILIAICVFAALVLGGYFINMFICWFGASYYVKENIECIIPLNDGLLYILGIIGFPMLMCCFACCLSLFKGISATNRIGFHPTYIV